MSRVISRPTAVSSKSSRSRRSKASSPAWITDSRLLWLRIAWTTGAAFWLFAMLSLLSFDGSDAPARSVFPHNTPTANWGGRFGAVFAYYTYETLGYGVWVLVAMSAAALWFYATGRKITHVLVRVLGAVMMAASIAGIQALLFPNSGPVQPIGGGLVGSNAAEQLLLRFSSVFTFIILAIGFVIGALVALDMWAVLVAMWAGRWMLAGAKHGAKYSARLGNAAADRLAEMRAKAEKRAADVREHDLDDADVPGRDAATPKPKSKKKDKAPTSDGAAAVAVLGAHTDDENDAAAPAAPAVTTSKDEPKPDRSSMGVPSADEGDDDENATHEEESVTPVFDPATLRAKMARLPVRFANKERETATEEDLRDIQTATDLEGYRFPGLDLLEEPEGNFSETMEKYVREQAGNLERALSEYKIDGNVVGVESGPVITLYEVKLAAGTKVAVLSALSSDLARSLKAVNIRIVPNTAGRDTVGIEVPNAQKEKVRLKELMSKFEKTGKMRLPMFLGKDASGQPLIEDLCAMPHLLIAGTTGSGKSVCMNSVLMSFLYTKKPNELKLVLVDPKMVELSQFKDIPHLMCPVVTEMSKAAAILEWAVRKMDERYELLAEAGVRDLAAYNDMPWEELKERFDAQTPEEESRIPRKLPYMVFVIDELADLMMTNKEVEGSIVRIAQKARAVGIHLILATQRPQANVVTGLIKSNMPGRIAFKVASGMDSRIVLDQKGGELLLGQGDMLYLSPRSHKLTRAQGTLVDDKEIRRVAKFMKEVAAPSFERQLMQIRSSGEEAEGTPEEHRDGFLNAQEDPMFDQAVEIVLETKRGSVSMLQRRLAIGYTRAARLIEMMGEAGILGGHKGTVAREVVLSLEEWHAMKAQWETDAQAAAANGDASASPASGGAPSANGSTPAAPGVQSDLFQDPEMKRIAKSPTVARFSSGGPGLGEEGDAIEDAFAEEDGWDQPGKPAPKAKKAESGDESAPF
jgi:DNA segregation ATPase FtsK/SpoIIIE, S-DNA-T family